MNVVNRVKSVVLFSFIFFSFKNKTDAHIEFNVNIYALDNKFQNAELIVFFFKYMYFIVVVFL